MSKNCQIMQRMKKNYETRSRTFLTRRTPVVIRLDGKAFHTYTKGLDKPFDEGLIEDMAETTKYLCENIQGAKLGYTQSDEISLLLTDYEKLGTDAWFDYSVQKMCSVAASMATARFNQLRVIRSLQINASPSNFEDWKQVRVLTLGLFDARAFNIPKEDVANYFLARQKDAVKNSVAMLAQSLYSHKELYKKNGADMQEMTFQKGHNWNNLHWSKKRGSTIVKNLYVNGLTGQEVLNIKDAQDRGMPQVTEWSILNDDGDYIDIEEPIVRSKWETILTPMTFDEEYLSKFI